MSRGVIIVSWGRWCSWISPPLAWLFSRGKIVPGGGYGPRGPLTELYLQATCGDSDNDKDFYDNSKYRRHVGCIRLLLTAFDRCYRHDDRCHVGISRASPSTSLLARGLGITANTSTKPSMTCVTSPACWKEKCSSTVKMWDLIPMDEPRRGITLLRRGRRLGA